MTAGLPGTGIGGLFYLLAALCLPLRFAWLRARGQRDRRHRVFVIRQLAMSMSMLAAVWLTGALLGLWRPLPRVLTVAPIVAPIVVTAGTLVAILIAVELGRLIIRPPASFGRGALRLRSGRHSSRETPPDPPG
jgi:hypothetical protein